MTNNIMMLYDNARISLTNSGLSYKVELEEEGYSIFIKENIVQEIIDKTDAEECFVVILLAYIEYTRRTVSPSAKQKKINETEMINSVSLLLQNFFPEVLIEAVKILRYFEIKEILTSKNPVLRLKKSYDV